MRLLSIFYFLTALFAFQPYALAQDCAALFKLFAGEESVIAAEWRLDVSQWRSNFQKLAQENSEIKYAEIAVKGESPLVYLHRTVPNPKLKLIITGGIHGNEGISVTTVYRLLEQLKTNPALKDVDLHVLPMLNEKGLSLHKRWHPEFGDLNREFTDLEKASPLANQISTTMQAILVAPKIPTLHLDLHGANLKNEFFTIVSEEQLALAKRSITGVKPEERIAHWADSFPLVLASPRKAEGGGILKSPYTFEEAGVATALTEGTLRNYVHDQLKVPSMVIEYPGQISGIDANNGQLNILLRAIEEAQKIR